MKLNQFFNIPLSRDIIALFAGAILTLAFAPFSLFPIAILSPALLLSTWISASGKRALWRGWLYGVGLFGTGVYWVFISIHTYGNASIFLASIITAGFIALLALFPALLGLILSRHFTQDNTLKFLCLFPAFWVWIEWLRGWAFTGFPWLFIGYSQINSPLKGYAPLFSVYGVSLAVVLSSGLLVNGFIYAKQKKYFNAAVNLLALVLLWAIGGYLSTIQWTQPKGAPFQVSLVQGNISQDLKWSIAEILPTLKHYQTLTATHWDSKIIIWPEAAIPLTMQDASDFLEQLHQQAKTHHATLITGVPIKDEKKNIYYNAVIAIGDNFSYYLKHRLVPFGEYTPFPHYLKPIMNLFNIPLSDLTPDLKTPEPLHANQLNIATFICYEIAYPEQVLSSDGNIDLLLTVSNDAWFGQSIAQAQHLEIARMRALEMGRPLLFVSNTGITAIINPDGKIQSAAPPYQTYVLTDRVQTTTGKTPWQRWGMTPLSITLLLLLLTTFRLRRK